MSSQHYQISELVREWNIEYIERDIGYANNEIKRITAFIDAASARLDYLKHLSFKFSVECNRYKYSSSPVHFKYSDGSHMVKVKGDVKKADPECKYIGRQIE